MYLDMSRRLTKGSLRHSVLNMRYTEKAESKKISLFVFLVLFENNLILFCVCIKCAFLLVKCPSHV